MHIRNIHIARENQGLGQTKSRVVKCVQGMNPKH